MNVFLGQLEVDFDVPNEVLGNYPVDGLFVQLPYMLLSRNLRSGFNRFWFCSHQNTNLFVCGSDTMRDVSQKSEMTC